MNDLRGVYTETPQFGHGSIGDRVGRQYGYKACR